MYRIIMHMMMDANNQTINLVLSYRGKQRALICPGHKMPHAGQLNSPRAQPEVSYRGRGAAAVPEGRERGVFPRLDCD